MDANYHFGDTTKSYFSKKKQLKKKILFELNSASQLSLSLIVNTQA
jgi:hypothetical protein